MKNKYIKITCIEIIIVFLYYYLVLPPINIQSSSFWEFVIFVLITSTLLTIVIGLKTSIIEILKDFRNIKKVKKVFIPIIMIATIGIGITLINFFCSPFFNAKSYSRRIIIDETGDFVKDIKEVDFNSLPLLDRDSSEKLGDRVMGQMSDLVSQFYVSDQYTQVNYNNEILRVTPLEYAGFIKWFSNKKEGIKAYITVNSVNGEAELVKINKGMKYMPSALFNKKLKRVLRFKYPTEIFGESKFEIDNEGKPYWITPTISYTGVELKTKINGVIILDPITGESKKYKTGNVPKWVDNAYSSSLIIEQVDDWGTYREGFLNSIFGQKNVVKTTKGYNYLAINDDIYLYTGITSVLADESNLGFILTNMRTGDTMFYGVAGAEEYSAMASAEGQVQQMKYASTFPLLINLNNKPTYLVSLKDAAGLVKMYGFIDVEDYQKVTVTDAGKGIKTAAQNYLKEHAEKINTDLIETTQIKIKTISSAVISGTTYYFITDESNLKYKISIELNNKIAFLNEGDSIKISYSDKKQEIIEVMSVE